MTNLKLDTTKLAAVTYEAHSGASQGLKPMNNDDVVALFKQIYHLAASAHDNMDASVNPNLAVRLGQIIALCVLSIPKEEPQQKE